MHTFLFIIDGLNILNQLDKKNNTVERKIHKKNIFGHITKTYVQELQRICNPNQ